MKKMMLLCSMLLLLQVTTFAQAYADWVEEERGDTLVIKDYTDMGNVGNSLYEAINADSVSVPEGRVYLLKNYGWYPVSNNPVSKAGQKIVIMGEINESLKLSEDVDGPAVFSGAAGSIGNLNSGGDLVVKNIMANAGNPGSDLGWTLFGNTADGRLTVENCILEHNQWVFINSPSNAKTYFKDNYMVNLVGHACRRNGGIIDFFSDQDSIVLENNTVVNAQGSLVKLREGYAVNRTILNHNTFVNCAGYVMMNIGNTGMVSLTNNLFVNSNVQGYCSAFQDEDAGEVDKRDIPMGLVNAIADSLALANNALTFYADGNAAYWSATWDDYISTLISNDVNDVANLNGDGWYSQRIIMSSETEALFNDDATYPLLTSKNWVEGVMPNFTDPQNLYTTALADVKTYCLATVDTASVEVLPNWRLVSTPVSDQFVFSDWPIPVDLSYDNAELLTAAMGGFPIGDLNWFPTQNAAWQAQKADEYQTIHDALTIVDVEVVEGPADKYELSQNYPNPFNPTTKISYTIPEASNVTLKVYDALGKEVATLVNEFQGANKYKVDFNANQLSSGVYIYKLEAGNFSITKKMLLLK